jgi:hypothetical protein
MTRFRICGIVILTIFVGCSSRQSPMMPDASPVQVSLSYPYESNRLVWGYWTLRFDPTSETVEIIPDREAGMHFNIVRLLEVAPCTDCLSIKNLQWLPDNVIQCDFELKHPYPGSVKLTGFDVRGVLVADGDTIFPVSSRLVSFDGSNPAMIDPDGYTALFNPTEFPAGSSPWPILGYIPGKLSSGDNFTATLNPFMAFGKDNPRRIFLAGTTETVTIKLKYPSAPFKFGYVVDASWVKPDEVIDPVTDFPTEANCLEPYWLYMWTLSLLKSEPGDSADVRVVVHDHQGHNTISTVSIECPQLFDGAVNLEYLDQPGDDAWIYSGSITNEKDAPGGTYPLLIKAISSESDANLSDLAAYQVQEIPVLGNGDLMWAVHAGEHWYDYGYGVTSLSDDSIVVTGKFSYSATFGEGDPNETVLFPYGYACDDIFVARL